jgi:tetratricopeptide (TPR) repeat protein
MVGQGRGAQQAPPVVSTALGASHKLLIDVEEYTALLTDYWTTFISDPVHLWVPNVSLSMDALYRELPHVKDEKPLQELLCRYHDFVANVFCDQEEYDEAIQHCNKGLRLAKRLRSDELKALVLYDWGQVLWEADRLNEAVQKYEEALRYEQKLRVDLRGCLLQDYGCARAQVAKTPEKKREAIAFVDRAGDFVRRKEIGDDPYFLHFNLDRYHLTRALSLIALGWNGEALKELKLVQAVPEHPRRQALYYIYQAQAYLNLGKYEKVVDWAESGLVVAQEINSKITIARVEKIYQQLKKSSYKDSSDVAHLDYLLRSR